MGRPQISVAKRLREQAKRERKQLKAEKRAQRKTDRETGEESDIETQDLAGATDEIEGAETETADTEA